MLAWTTRTTETGTWCRFAVQTPWFEADDDLGAVLDAATIHCRRPGDTVAVSEKVAVLLTGRAIPRRTVVPGRLAHALARRVHTVGNSRGLSVPEKMQLVLDRQGRGRVALAAASTALLRPLGRHGSFYRIAGTFARDLDGLRPPYLDLLLPPLQDEEARLLAEQLQARLGTGVAIVDINDRGGSVRAVSSWALPSADLEPILADNPMGQGQIGTPFVLVRHSSTGPQPAKDLPELAKFIAPEQMQHRQVYD